MDGLIWPGESGPGSHRTKPAAMAARSPGYAGEAALRMLEGVFPLW